MFCKKGIFKNFAKFSEEHLFLSLQRRNSAEKDPNTGVFYELCEFFKNTSGGCFLNYYSFMLKPKFHVETCILQTPCFFSVGFKVY